MFSHVRTLPALGAVVLLPALACSDPMSNGDRRPVALSFAAAPSIEASGAQLALAVPSSPLVITRAQLVFAKTELEIADGACTVPEHDDDCPEIESGPVLVDVPLDGTTRSVLVASIPTGAYEEFEAEIEVADSDDTDDRAAVEAFLAAHPEFRGVSIRVEGTYAGEPFVFTTDVEAEFEFEFEPPLVVAAGSHNITVVVDVANWFRRQDGSVIDPRTANQGGPNKGLVDGNIERSFDAFEDDDRNGRND